MGLYCGFNQIIPFNITINPSSAFPEAHLFILFFPSVLPPSKHHSFTSHPTLMSFPKVFLSRGSASSEEHSWLWHPNCVAWLNGALKNMGFARNHKQNKHCVGIVWDNWELMGNTSFSSILQYFQAFVKICRLIKLFAHFGKQMGLKRINLALYWNFLEYYEFACFIRRFPFIWRFLFYFQYILFYSSFTSKLPLIMSKFDVLQALFCFKISRLVWLILY